MCFGIEQYDHMAQMLRSIKGKAILSINDHPDMREVFKGLPTKTTSIKYTVGAHGRGQNRQELIIKNW